MTKVEIMPDLGNVGARRTRGSRLWLLCLATMVTLGACAPNPLALLDEARGSVAQNICSKVFISGLSPDDVMRDHLRPEPGMNLIAWAISTDIDKDKGEVTTRLFGQSRAARFAKGRGCTLAYPGYPPPEPLTHAEVVRVHDLAPEQGIVTGSPTMAAVLDEAFAEPAQGPRLATQAVVIVRHGKIIAERYAPGLGPDTALLSHSIAKSFVNALTGILVRQGKLNVTAPAAIPAWLDDKDPRRNVTVEQLLRMNAGFGFDEGRGASIATHIWFGEPDTAKASGQSAAIIVPPNTWGYCSRCFTLLGRLVGDAVGGGPQELTTFAWRELFEPLGMTSVQMEFDAAGTMMGAQALFATPRDFARFGLLYLRDGLGPDGTRILPEGWVAWSSQPKGDAGYGAGFWLNTTDHEIKAWSMPWGMPGAPKDTFFARGYMGQYIVIVPSQDLVIVRMGQSHGPGAGIASVGRLVKRVIDAP